MKYILGLFFLSYSFCANGQILNDECKYATYIQDVEEYCSEPLVFTTVGATASPQTDPDCWPQGTNSNDVWFSFTPKNLGVLIQLTGQTLTNEGTLDNPSLAIYTGDCNGLQELACSSELFDENVLEVTLTDLSIGSLYFIRVDGRNGNTGSFKLCINTFSPIKSPESDCIDGVVLCNKEEILVEKVESVGDDTNEVTGSCIQEELASVWYKWTCKDAGTLTFNITPNNKTDDIDFAVYELNGGLDGCGSKRPIRCMASGETIGSSEDFNSPCFGATGLNLTSTDLEEQPGCNNGSDNYVKYIDMEAGVSYALIVNNYSRSGAGFKITWGGSGTFLGPDADFTLYAQGDYACDKTIIFTNKSSSLTDSIVNYTWSFGNANPSSVSNKDTVHVVYPSFGDKTAAIVVESKRGCIVTKVIDFYVNPCCRDTTTLSVQGIVQDLICANIYDGQIEGVGKNGSPEYMFSTDGENYQPNPRFFNLKDGTYSLYIIDSKGCEDSVTVVIAAPPPLIADAGADQTIELGETTILDGNYTPPGNVITTWFGEGFLDSTLINTLNPEVLPPGTYTYTLQVQDEFGCVDTDQVTIRVKIVRPVFSPNVFSPNGDGSNEHFTLFGGPAVENIRKLLVYDRWGNLMYQGRDLKINDSNEGWDGKFNGKFVNPGVYVWKADVLFIDDVVLTFSGDVTVLR